MQRMAILLSVAGLAAACASTPAAAPPPAGAPSATARTEQVKAAVPATSTHWWAHWRGPSRNGVSAETGLISSWSIDGENLLWKVPLVARSTPIVLGDRVCTNGRVGEDILRQEMVACFDVATGEKLWEHRFNVFHTSVPWTRVGWANLAGDPETGYLYAQGVAGIFLCLDSATGEVVWSRRFIEEYGFMEGYGGRTQTPLVDGDKVVITFSNTSWGSEGRPLHRLRAFDKRTGELLWVSQPAPSQADKNTQSTPNVLEVDGRRLIVAGNGGGGIYAVEAETGEPVWGFQLSKRGINTSVVVDGTRVFASHSEENFDEGSMGRVVAIDGTGSGDVTATHEIWRAPISAGFGSHALADGVLYVLDNSANLYALDADTGEAFWELNIGRVGKASPVLADGKLYVTEVNGQLVILELGDGEPEILDIEEIPMPDGRAAEIYGSVAIADGRIFFTTEEGLYALGGEGAGTGTDTATAAATRSGAGPASDSPTGPAARLRVVPADVTLRSDESADFRALAFDATGRPLGEQAVTWSLAGLDGSIDADGVYDPEGSPSSTGFVVATVGDLEARGRVRALSHLPLEEDFESTEPGAKPPYMMAYLARFAVADLDGNRVLAKGPSPVKIHRHITFLGHPDESGYTIEADLMGTRKRRTMPDVGLINSGYTMELLGNHQRVQVRSWQSGLRMMQQIDFAWSEDTWYRMKLSVDTEGSGADAKAVVRGKVWPKTEAEPEDWTITVEDPLPIPRGAPGLSGYSPTPIYFDNIRVVSNDQAH